MSSLQLYPEVIDAATLQPKLTSSIFLPVAIEGQKDAGGTAVVGTIYAINRVDESSVAFGPASPLHARLIEVLKRGAGPVLAIASASGTAPTLVQRQAAWQKLESDATTRIRLTDSNVQADLVGLATSVANADVIHNKQFALVGMPSGTTKAALITAAAAIAAAGTNAAQRTVLIGPGVYNELGTLIGGSYAAACVAAELAKNADPSNDIDLWPIPFLTGIERGADGLPVFRRQVVSGTAVNDFEDLLQGGVSPLQPNRAGSGVITTHLRTVFLTDRTFDALMTRVIVDEIFLDVKNYIYDGGFLRMGNTQQVRDRIRSGVIALLTERSNWITGVTQPDGSIGYNVSVTPSPDFRQLTIGYEGTVVRGIQTVLVAPTLTIPV